MLQIGPFTYLMITDNILILHFEISAYTAYTGYKGKIEEDMFSESYIHLMHPVYIRVQNGTHQRFCLQLIFYAVHLRKRGYTAYNLVSNVRSIPTFSEMYNINYYQQTGSVVCADLYSDVDRVYK